jgi:hypothetical protein
MRGDIAAGIVSSGAAVDVRSQMPPLTQNTMNWFQVIAWVAGAVAVIVAVLKFWSEFSLAREQRARELRWKQAEAGKSLNDEMLTDLEAASALRMLDFDGREIEVPGVGRTAVTHLNIRRALDPESEAHDRTELHIRDCFDSLFYYLATLEHYIESTLILREDVAFPLDYYVPLLATLKPQVEMYLQQFGLRGAAAFLLRYEAWR